MSSLLYNLLDKSKRQLARFFQRRMPCRIGGNNKTVFDNRIEGGFNYIQHFLREGILIDGKENLGSWWYESLLSHSKIIHFNHQIFLHGDLVEKIIELSLVCNLWKFINIRGKIRVDEFFRFHPSAV